MVVGVEDVVKLGTVVAHAVGTVDTSGSITVDTGADGRGLAADEAKDVTVVVRGEVVGADARQGGLHAGAKAGVRGGGEVVDGLPVIGQSRAAGGLVGGLVVAGVNTLGVGLGNLRLESAEVLELGNLVVLDGDETWNYVSYGTFNYFK